MGVRRLETLDKQTSQTNKFQPFLEGKFQLILSSGNLDSINYKSNIQYLKDI